MSKYRQSILSTGIVLLDESLMTDLGSILSGMLKLFL